MAVGRPGRGGHHRRVPLTRRLVTPGLRLPAYGRARPQHDFEGNRMRRTLVTAIALALAGTAPVLAAEAGITMPVAAPEVKDATTQLPRNVRPTHYDIAVTPDASTLTFKGHVAIALDVLEPTDA